MTASQSKFEQGRIVTRTITSEVGTGPIATIEPDLSFDSTEPPPDSDRVVIPLRKKSDRAVALDRRREVIEPNPKGSDAPLGEHVAATDDGPIAAFTLARAEAEERERQLHRKKANDNKPKKKPDYLRKMFEKVELGNGSPENQLHWEDVKRFKHDLRLASGEPMNDSAQSQWRELMPEFTEGFFGNHVNTIERDDGPTQDEDGEFLDNGIPAECEVARRELATGWPVDIFASEETRAHIGEDH